MDSQRLTDGRMVGPVRCRRWALLVAGTFPEFPRAGLVAPDRAFALSQSRESESHMFTLASGQLRR
jgi:hypothetical protein